MKFLIIGDSWGCGEFRRIDNGKNIEVIPDTGPDYYLKNLGHEVVNLSRGGDCNFSGILRSAMTHLNTNEQNIVDNDYDYIIWFHTEPIRDLIMFILNDNGEHLIEERQIDINKFFPNFQQYKFYDGMQYICECNYTFAQQIYNRHQIPFIVVGGVGYIDNCIKDFSFAKFTITSWLSELLGNVSVPQNMCIHPDMERAYRYYKSVDAENFLNEIDISDTLINLLFGHTKFPDNLHPNKEEIEKLTYRILEMVKNA